MNPPLAGADAPSARHRVLVTGGSGFVGSAVARGLSQVHDTAVRVSIRERSATLPGTIEQHRVGDLSASTDWAAALRDIASVVHAAARVHVMRDRAADPLAEFRRVNVAGTLTLARQAAKAGVRRFVFVSSIKVNGEETPPDRPFTAESPAAPVDPYGVSKFEAEQGLREIALQTGMAVVIIRPVLVYGPGVRANVRAMMRAVQAGLPLPLGAVHNRRSLVALDNLVDLIARCLVHPGAANETFLVSDGEDLSTTALLRRIGMAMQRPVRLLPVPVAVLETGAALLGKGAVARRLCGSLAVDITRTRARLQWSPPVSVDDALRATVAAYLHDRRRR